MEGGYWGILSIACVFCGIFPVTAESATELSESSAAVIDDYDACGRVALYGACKLKGMRIGWEELTESFGAVSKDHLHSFATLHETARKIGLHPIGVHATRDDLLDVPTPAIVQTLSRASSSPPHFKLLLSTAADGVWLLDPPHAHNFLSWSKFEKQWSGKVLLLADTTQRAEQIRSMFSSSLSASALYWTLVITPVVLLAAAGVILLQRLLPTTGHSSLVTAVADAHRRITGSLQGLLFSPDRKMTSSALWRVGVATTTVMLLGLVLVGSIYAVTMFRSPPMLIFERAELNLGELSPGSHKVRIPFKNSGWRGLQIERVVSSCACTTVDAPKRVDPGASALIEAEVAVTGGPQGATLVVYSNDSSGPRHITLNWLGKASPKLLPPRLMGRAVSGGDPVLRTVRLVYRSGSSHASGPRVKQIDCEDARVKVEVGEDDRTAISTVNSLVVGELVLNVAISPPKTPALVKTECKILIEYADLEYTLTLPISFNFISGFRCEPESVLFSALLDPDLLGQERVIRLLSDSSKTQFSIAQCPTWLQCELLDVTSGSSEMAMHLLQIPAISERLSKVVVATNDGAQLEIPARTFVLGRD